MDNLSFVKRFITGTKEECIQWSDMKGAMPLPVASEGFYTVRGNNDVVIMRLDSNNYVMAIWDIAGTEIYRIDEDNLLYDADGDMIANWDSDDEHALSRLFRLAERSAKRIDSLLDELTKDLPDDAVDLLF